MTAESTKPQAKKAAPAARKTTPAKKATRSAKQTVRSAESTARQARKTTAQAERTVRGLVSDSAYAVLGVGDSAVGVLRHVPEGMERFRKDAPETVEGGVRKVEQRVRTLWTDTPEEVQTRLEAVRRNAGEEFASYAKRGRAVASSVRQSKPTTLALKQAKTARSQVKGALTSLRKAVGASVEAVDDAADRVGEDRAG